MALPILALALLLVLALVETGSSQVSALPADDLAGEAAGVVVGAGAREALLGGRPEGASSGPFAQASSFLDQDTLRASSLLATQDLSDLAEALRVASKATSRPSDLDGLSSIAGARPGRQSDAGGTSAGSGGSNVRVETEFQASLEVGQGNGFGVAADGRTLAERLEGLDSGQGSWEVDERPMSAAEKLAKEFQYAMVRIQSISEGFNWFKPFFPGAEEDAVGSGFAVKLNTTGFSTVPADPDKDPVFVTNAHVVRNAHTVRIQLPAMGQQDFAAYVPLIFDKLDLALVRLEEPAKFLQYLAENVPPIQLKVLPIKEDPPMSMGMEVAALGFPLGTTSLKISRGVIAGTEQVQNKLCLQSSAPISPGSSGGPLFSVEDMGQQESQSQVIGVNFAASASQTAQNNNYVVPLVHIRQLLNEYREIQAGGSLDGAIIGPEKPYSGVVLFKPGGAADPMPVNGKKGTGAQGKQPSKLRDGGGGDPTAKEEEAVIEASKGDKVRLMGNDGTQSSNPGSGTLGAAGGRRGVKTHHQMRIAPVMGVVVESNSLLYETSNGCKKGVFVSKIPKPSVLEGIPERSFLVKVGNTSLDKFGMGRHEGYLDNPLPFQNLMALQEQLKDDVTITYCKDGKESVHRVNMMWNDKYELGVPIIEEPLHQAWARDFEVFAGVTVAEMTANHIQRLVSVGADPRLGRFMSPEARKNPRLLIVHSQSGTYASHVLQPGMIVEKINGRNISSLKGYRNHFLETYFNQPEGGEGVWKLETDEGVMFEVLFEESWKHQMAQLKESRQFDYLATPAVRSVLRVQLLRQRVDQLLTELEKREAGEIKAGEIKQLLSTGFEKLKAAGENTSVQKLRELIQQAEEKMEEAGIVVAMQGQGAQMDIDEYLERNRGGASSLMAQGGQRHQQQMAAAWRGYAEEAEFRRSDDPIV